VPTTEPLMAATDLCRRYERGGSRDRTNTGIDAVRHVSLRLEHGESLAIVGRSGSGKSTLARLLLAIDQPDRGEVRFEGRVISGLPERRIRPLRRHFQAVFQDPGSSLDPCLRVGSIIAEPLAAHRIGSARERRRRVREVLDRVGLRAGAERAFPDAFSGGERQRIAIARALAPDPKLLVLDEPVSSLDASVQTEIIDLLLDLRRDFRLALIMISHDLAVVRELCERVAVMDGGSLVEVGRTEDVLARPEHPVTRTLLDASLSLNR
jgi:ABC-type glutathione transport system ATPase component